MRYIKKYKLYESKMDIQDGISVIYDFLSELSDNGYDITHQIINNTRVIVYITKGKSEIYYWNDISEEVLRLIDLSTHNGLIFRHMGYNYDNKGKLNGGLYTRRYPISSFVNTIMDEEISLLWVAFDIK
jgi:hypothetical protein